MGLSIDREKVKKGLECCQYSSKSHCDGCPYVYDGLCNTNDCTADLASDAIAMLKEQEPMQVKTDMYGNAYCPWCSTDRSIEMGAHRLHLGTQFCQYCGKAVKWE